MSLEKEIRVALRDAGIPIEKDKFGGQIATLWILGHHEYNVAKDALIEAGLTVEGTEGPGNVHKIMVWKEANAAMTYDIDPEDSYANAWPFDLKWVERVQDANRCIIEEVDADPISPDGAFIVMQHGEEIGCYDVSDGLLYTNLSKDAAEDLCVPHQEAALAAAGITLKNGKVRKSDAAKAAFVLADEQDAKYTLWKTDQDGGEVGHEDYDTLEELYRDWPNATKISEHTYEDWVGGRA